MNTCRIALIASILAALTLTGCADEKKKTHKITIEGPQKKTELKVETTEKKKDKD